MTTFWNDVESMLTNWDDDYAFRCLLAADKCEEAGETELAKIIRWYVSTLDSVSPPITVKHRFEEVNGMQTRYFLGYSFQSDGQVADTMIELLIKLKKQELRRVFNRTLENAPEYERFWRTMGWV